jgi:hypothetical protein
MQSSVTTSAVQANSDHPRSDPELTAQFLRDLFEKSIERGFFLSGAAELPNRPRHIWHLPTERFDPAEFDFDDRNFFFGNVLRRADLGRWRQGKENAEELALLNHLWLTVDVQSAVSSAQGNLPPRPVAWEVFQAVKPLPKFVIDAGTQLTAIWPLGDPIGLTSENFAAARSALRRSQAVVRRHFARHDFDVADASALRGLVPLPGSISYAVDSASLVKVVRLG